MIMTEILEFGNWYMLLLCKSCFCRLKCLKFVRCATKRMFTMLSKLGIKKKESKDKKSEDKKSEDKKSKDKKSMVKKAAPEAAASSTVSSNEKSMLIFNIFIQFPCQNLI